MAWSPRAVGRGGHIVLGAGGYPPPPLRAPVASTAAAAAAAGVVTVHIAEEEDISRTSGATAHASSGGNTEQIRSEDSASSRNDNGCPEKRESTESDGYSPRPATPSGQSREEEARASEAGEMARFRCFVKEVMMEHMPEKGPQKYADNEDRKPLTKSDEKRQREEDEIVAALDRLTDGWDDSAADAITDEPTPGLDLPDHLWGPGRRVAPGPDANTVVPDDISQRSTIQSACSQSGDSWHPRGEEEQYGPPASMRLSAAVLHKLPSPYGIGYDGDFVAPQKDEDVKYFMPRRPPRRLQKQVIEYGAEQMLRRLQGPPPEDQQEEEEPLPD